MTPTSLMSRKPALILHHSTGKLEVFFLVFLQLIIILQIGMMYVFGNTKYEYNFKYSKHFCFGVKQRIKHWMCIVSVPAMYFGVNYQ